MKTKQLLYLLLMCVCVLSCNDDEMSYTPSAEDASYTINRGEMLTFDISISDTEDDDDLLVVDVIEVPEEGILTLSNGTDLIAGEILSVSDLIGLSYQSLEDYSISELSFEYTVTNSEGLSDEGVISIVIGPDYLNGLIVSAEGAWGARDGSVSFVSDDLATVPSDYIYEAVNGAQLGGLIQSIAFSDENAYIVLNDVNSLVVVDRYTFEIVGSINTGFDNPRYMAIVGDKGYVTNWGPDTYTTNDDYLAVIDLTTNTLETETISLSFGVEQIIASGDKLYVSHKGAYTSNNIISVVDTANSNAITEITVNDSPDEIIIDDSGDLIVLCEGNTLYNADWSVAGITTASISFVNTSTNEVTNSIEFPENENASLLSYENGNVYYYQGSTGIVYEIEESATSLATTGIDVSSIYGMSVNDGNLYTVTYNFIDLSELFVYDIATGDGVYSNEVGLGASKIYFN